MKFVGGLRKITDTKYQIGLVHNMPFDPVDGMGMTEEELNAIGALVDDVPEPLVPEGKQTCGLFINPQTKGIFYEYEDKPITETDRIAAIEVGLAQMLGM